MKATKKFCLSLSLFLCLLVFFGCSKTASYTAAIHRSTLLADLDTFNANMTRFSGEIAGIVTPDGVNTEAVANIRTQVNENDALFDRIETALADIAPDDEATKTTHAKLVSGVTAYRAANADIDRLMDVFEALSSGEPNPSVLETLPSLYADLNGHVTSAAADITAWQTALAN